MRSQVIGAVSPALKALKTIEYLARRLKDAFKWIALAVAAVHVYLDNDLDAFRVSGEQA